jgi:co-chaperonin GroES (HSP10)
MTSVNVITDQILHLTKKVGDVLSSFRQSDSLSIEVEARLWKISDNGIYPLSSSDFYRIKNHLDKRIKVTTEYSEDSIDTTQSIRKTLIPNEGDAGKPIIKWMIKKPLHELRIDEVGVKIAISKEQLLPIAPTNFNPSIYRTKKRWSYHFNPYYIRLDLTVVTFVDKDNNTQSKYEMEIECTNKSYLKNFLIGVSDFVRALHGTDILYTLTDLQQLTKTIQKDLKLYSLQRFNREVLVQARNMKKEDLVYGGIIGNVSTTYSVTHKADGQRKVLVFDKTGLWSVMPPYEYNHISTYVDPNVIGTYLDGEMIPMEHRLDAAPKTKYWFIAFDCLCIQHNENIDIRELPLHDRTVISTEVAEKNSTKDISINSKAYKELNTVMDLFAIMSEMKVESTILSYKTDGFMFVPTLLAYNNNSHLLPLNERELTKYPDIIKWKPFQELTIDFKVINKIDNVSKSSIPHLYCSKRGIKDPVEFLGSSGYPFIPTKDTIQDKSEDGSFNLKNLSHGSVVEMTYNNGKFVPKKLRMDKEVGNDIEVGQNIWEDIHHPIPLSTLIGDNLHYVKYSIDRTFHQLMKCRYGTLVLFASKDVIEAFWTTFLDLSKIHLVCLVSSHNFNSPSATLQVVQTLEIDTEDIACVIGFMSSVPKELYDSPQLFPIVEIGFDKYLVSSLIPITGKKIVFDPPMDWLNGEYPLIDIKKKDVSKRYLIDTWTLNYEPLMSEVEKELSRLIRVLIYFPTRVYRLSSTHLVKDENYPIRRKWFCAPLMNELVFPVHSKTCVALLSNMKFEEVPKQNYYYKNIENDNDPSLDPQLLLQPKRPIEHPLPIMTNISTGLIHSESILPLLKEDKTDILKCSWYTDNSIVRIGTIADGSCFLHSILKGYNTEYQVMKDLSERTEYARSLRTSLAVGLDLIDPDSDRQLTFYETAGDGTLAELGKNYIPNNNDAQEHIEDFTLDSIKKLFMSDEFLGHEVYALIANMLGINIYILRCTKDEVFKHEVYIKNKDYISCIIVGDGIHYETIGLQTSDGIMTVFPNDHKFLKLIEKSKLSYNGKERNLKP